MNLVELYMDEVCSQTGLFVSILRSKSNVGLKLAAGGLESLED